MEDVIVYECLDCCKEFEIDFPITEEEEKNISCPYCHSGDIAIKTINGISKEEFIQKLGGNNE